MDKLIVSSIILVLLFCSGCNKNEHRTTARKSPSREQAKKTGPEKKVIHILPLGEVKAEYVNEVVSAVKKFYGYDCVVLPQVKPTDDIMAASRMRYEAGKILQKYNSKEFLLILTTEDIACRTEKSSEWGIFGLGYMPGTTCVVSTFRLRRTNGYLVSSTVLMERLDKICLHEIGHNLGLDHCMNDPRCMMNTADGTIRQVDREKIWFCDKCTVRLKL
jgi:archaemetzincin